MLQRKNSYSIKKQKGFTLMELSMVAAILGFVAISMTSTLSRLATIRTQAEAQNDLVVNQKIATAMLQYAENGNTSMLLPNVYTAGTATPRVYFGVSPTTGTLAQNDFYGYLLGQGVSPSFFNVSEQASKKVRVFQKIPVGNLSADVPVGDYNGDSFTLDYELGVVYQTQCNAADTSCNTSTGTLNTVGRVSSAPNTAAKLTWSNYTTWLPPANATGVVMVSTLPLQRKKLQELYKRIDAIRVASRNYVGSVARPISCTKTVLVNGTTPTSKTFSNIANPYPFNPCAAGTGTNYDLTQSSAANATSNGNCWDGWYMLNSAATDIRIMDELGLSKSEFGSTPWGNSIWYCANYAAFPSSKSATTAPYLGAIRIYRYLTETEPAWSSATAADWVVLSL